MSNIMYFKLDLDEVENDMRAAMEDLHERCRKLRPPRKQYPFHRPTLGSQGTVDRNQETPDP